MINFVRRRFTFLFVSLAVLLVAVIALGVFHMKLGLQFSSGTTVTLAFTRDVSEGELRSKLSELGYPEAQIQGTNLDGYVVTVGSVTQDELAKLKGAMTDKFSSAGYFVDTTALGDETAVNVILSRDVPQKDVEAAFQTAGITWSDIKSKTTAAYIVRTKTISQDASADGGLSARAQLESDLAGSFGGFGEFDFYSVSPAVASSVVQKAIIAVVIAVVAILLYISFAFRRMPNPFRWGTCAIITVVHNVLLVLGVFAILGKVLQVEIDAMFITGILTVIGYSVHDTIVVFDRIRENVRRGVSKDFAVVVNNSLLETIGRSLNTSLTTLFVLLALLFIGGVTLRYFILVMVLGIAIGTYSSMFVASQLLVVWDKHEWRRFISWIPFLRPASEQ